MTRAWSRALAAVALAVFACKSPVSDGKHQEVVPIQVTVTPSSANLLVGQQVTLSASVTGSTTNYNVTWSSNNTAVATVSGGVVTGVGPGICVVTATSVADPSKAASAAVSVVAVGTASVEITPPAPSLQAGTTLQLQAVVKDGAGGVVPGRTVAWLSGDTTIARVSSAGLLSGIGAGQTTITASADGKSGTATATVTLVAPRVTTDSAAGISADSARLWGYVEGWGAQYSILFHVAGNPSYSPTDSSLTASSRLSQYWHVTWDDLPGSTTYYYRVVARNAAGSTISAGKSFTTLPAGAPRIDRVYTDSVGPGNARFNVEGGANGASTVLDFQVGSSATTLATLSGCDTLHVGYLSHFDWWCRSFRYRGSTTYWYRVIASNSVGTTASSVGSFTTLPATAPTVSTLAPDSVTSTLVRIWGFVTPNGADATTSFQWGTSAANLQTLAGCSGLNVGLGATGVWCRIPSLLPNTTYYYSFSASNSVGSSFGSVKSLTTAASGAVNPGVEPLGAPSAGVVEAGAASPGKAVAGPAQAGSAVLRARPAPMRR